MDGMEESITIIHAPAGGEPFVIVDKPSGLPSAPLREGDDSAVTRLLPRFPEIADVRGRKPVEGGLLHRLDTMTSGLLLLATSQDFYDRMLAEQDAGRFVKRYSAECDAVSFLPPGFPPQREAWRSVPGIPPGGQLPAEGPTGLLKPHEGTPLDLSVESRFRPWGPHGREVRPVSEGAGRGAEKKASPGLYRTEVRLDLDGSGTAHADCRITRGYRHQVRCHLAWLGFPVKGDRLYNATAREGDAFCFRATGLEFLGLLFRLN